MTTFWSRERLTNTSTTGSQTESAVAVLADGGYVVVWTDESPATDVIRLQRFDAFGNPVGVETNVGTSATSDPRPEIVVLPNGSFAVAWMSNGTDIVMQRFTAAGVADGVATTLATNSENANFDKAFDLVALSNGTMALAYVRSIAFERDAVLKIVSAAGVAGAEIVIDAAVPSAGGEPYIATNGTNIAVTWRDSAANAGDIQARTFNLTGGAPTAEITVNTQTASTQIFSPIAALADGLYVVVWQDRSDDSVRGQILSSSLAPQGAEFIVGFGSTTAESIAVTATSNGGFFVAYRGAGGALFGQSMTNLGQQDGNRVMIAGSVSTENSVELASLADGRVAATYTASGDLLGLDTSGSGIYTRIVDPRGEGFLVQGRAGADVLLGNETSNDWITGFDGVDTIHGLGGDDTLEGGGGGDDLFGGDGDDFLYGGGSSDELHGQAGNDVLDGEGSGDFIFGQDGDDRLTGGVGFDFVDGGAGFDHAVYAFSRASYTLARTSNTNVQVTGIGAAAGDGVDTVLEIERLQFADVTLAVAPSFDFTGDFAPDVVLRNINTNQISFWDLENAAFSSSTQLGALAATTAIVDSGDFNRDGFSDILLRDASTGAISVIPILAGVQQATFQIGGVGANIEVVGSADFNSDNFSEILLRDRTTGAVTFWALNPDGRFGASVSLGGVLANIEVIGTGDFFGDGDSDVLLRNVSSGAVSVWQIEDNAFVSSTTVGGVGANFTVVGAFDFTGDAIADILLHNRSTGAVSYWQTDAAGNFVASVEIGGITSNTTIVDARDINGDGFADVLLRDSTDGSVDAFTVVNGAFSAFVALGGAGTAFVFA